jgi:hypothetical protein
MWPLTLADDRSGRIYQDASQIERVRFNFAGFCRVSACIPPAILIDPKRRQDAGGPKCAGTWLGRRGGQCRRLTPTSSLRTATVQSFVGHWRSAMTPRRF